MHRTLFRALFATLLGGTLAAGQPPRFSEHILRKLHNETVTGYALQERTLVTWGDRLLWGRLPQGNYQVVRGRGLSFAEGDEANIGRFTELVKEMSVQTQFVLITHSKKTMSIAPVLYGVTMQEPGVSKLVSVRFGSPA